MTRMTTRRSLNKLEYKAHMSIHNTAEVSQGAQNEGHESAYTRDRLGRPHKLFEGDGTSRIFKPVHMTLAVLFFLCSMASACSAIPENVQVSSDELGQKSFDERLGTHEKEEKFSVFDDGNKSLGFNEDGDPNVAMRF